MKKLFWGMTWLCLFIFGCQTSEKAQMEATSHNMAGTLGYTAGRNQVEAKKEAMDSTKSAEGEDKTSELNTEKYKDYGVNPYQDPKQDPFSTFAIDVDTASYTITRRKLNENQIPPKEAVRVEEFVNFFPPEYEKNRKEWFQVHLDASPSPFRPKYHLMRVVVQGKDLTAAERKPANLVFLVDVSGSMSSGDKIGLVKESLKLLVEALDERDYVSICTYAGSVRTVLQPTNAQFKSKIIDALDELGAGGSTAMASGILNAYSLANVNFRPEVVNRVIVCSDGDANVGASNHEEILKLIEDYKDKGITLSTIGFGMGNYQDVMMEQLADKGNGNYSYVDTIAEGKRVFVEQLTGTLQVIAKDMKIQVEFNPETVKSYRLIGYENRDVRDIDFRNDKIDGGEVGSGHTVTALYDLELMQQEGWLCHVFVRAKQPEGSAAEELRFALEKSQIYPNWDKAPKKFRFIACVSEFAELLRESPHVDTPMKTVWAELEKVAREENERENEFMTLVKKAISLKG